MAEQSDSEARRGISRRDLLKRGAIVGGTLLWAAPVVESLAAPAFASTSPVFQSCCECAGTKNGNTVYYALVDDYDCATCESACPNAAPPGVTSGHMVKLYHGTNCQTQGGTNSGMCAVVSTCPDITSTCTGG